MKIWILHPQRFYPAVVQHLAEYNIQVTYICAAKETLKAFRGLPPECIMHSFWDAMAGQLPSTFRDHVVVADPAIIERLALSESLLLQMFERLNYTGLAIHDLRRIYFRYVALWCHLLDGAAPDAVVFHIVPHQGFDYVLYLLCRLRNIKTLIFERTYLPDRLLIIDAVEKMPKPVSLKRYRTIEANREPVNNTDDANYYDARNRSFEDKRQRRLTKLDLVRDSIWRVVLFFLQVGRRPLTMTKPYYCSMYSFAPRMPTRLEYLWRDTVDMIHMYHLRDFYESNTKVPDLNADYIYYPLQFQPERTSIPMGRHFADQLLGLNMLVKSLPPDWYVYVKEHPRQFTDNPVRARLGRSTRFYEALIGIQPDKVRLMSISMSSDALLRNSRCVATVAGTAGWEAVRIGIPALVFGTPWYINCPGVFQVSSAAECASILDRVRLEETVDLNEVQAFAEWIGAEASFPGYIGDVFAEASKLSPDENARSYAKAIASRVAETAKQSV